MALLQMRAPVDYRAQEGLSVSISFFFFFPSLFFPLGRFSPYGY